MNVYIRNNPDNILFNETELMCPNPPSGNIMGNKNTFTLYLSITMAHHRQKVKMQYSVLGVSNEKTIFLLVIPLDNR